MGLLLGGMGGIRGCRVLERGVSDDPIGPVMWVYTDKLMWEHMYSYVGLH